MDSDVELLMLGVQELSAGSLPWDAALLLIPVQRCRDHGAEIALPTIT